MERALTAREYFMHLKQADPTRCTVSKTLTCFTWGSTYWELNSFKGASHVAILEVEAESMEGDVRIPEFVSILREVTEEPSYDSYLLASELARKVSRAVDSPRDFSQELKVERQMSDALNTLEKEAASSKFRATSTAARFAARLKGRSPSSFGDGAGGDGAASPGGRSSPIGSFASRA